MGAQSDFNGWGLPESTLRALAAATRHQTDLAPVLPKATASASEFGEIRIDTVCVEIAAGFGLLMTAMFATGWRAWERGST